MTSGDRSGGRRNRQGPTESESRFIPILDKVGPARLRLALHRLGVPIELAGGMVWHLDDLAAHRSLQSRVRRGTYRSRFEQIDPDDLLAAAEALDDDEVPPSATWPTEWRWD